LTAYRPAPLYNACFSGWRLSAVYLPQFFFCCCCVALGPARAQAQQNGNGAIEIIRASEAEYVTVGEGDEGIFILRGGIIVRSGMAYLRAETVKINTRTGEIFGEGKVSFEAGREPAVGRKILFRQQAQRGGRLLVARCCRPVSFYRAA
jgi:hypothetical protein